VLRVGLDGGRERQHRILVGADDDGDLGQRRLTLRQRAGLVEDDRVELPSTLEREPVLHEQALTCADRGRDRDHQWDGEPQGVRAGDHQHGRGTRERALGVAEDPPGDEGDGPRRQRDIEEQRGRAVGKGLGA
jgi:hypothetical protein